MCITKNKNFIKYFWGPVGPSTNTRERLSMFERSTNNMYTMRER